MGIHRTARYIAAGTAVAAASAIGLISPVGLGTIAPVAAAEGSGTYARWTFDEATSSGTISFGKAYPTATFVTDASGPSRLWDQKSRKPVSRGYFGARS